MNEVAPDRSRGKLTGRVARLRIPAFSSRWLPGLLAVVLLSGCAAQRFGSVPPPEPAFALAAQPSDRLAPVEAGLTAQYGDGVSGFELLDSNEDGLRWRLALVDSARRSIDLQYYLWYADSSGLLMIERLLDAADRGVRVRLLVDDISALLHDASTVKLRDHGAALLDSHPNIELRLFNPWSRRGLASRAGEALTDMKRLNQRMHHKVLIADNRAAVIGGRNIGDEYFGLNQDFNFHDLDVIGIGPIAREASQVFDAFWNSDWVLPASALAVRPNPQAVAEARSTLQARLRGRRALERFELEPRDWSADFEALAGRLHAGSSEMLTDVPAAGEIAHEMLASIYQLLLGARHEVLIINAYIIPGDTAIETFRRLTGNGVTIRILTNSLASHDVPAVNSHYKQRRRDLLAAGVQLFEMRHDAAIQSIVSDTPPVRAEFMGLHSKAMVIDRERAYVGSMNFDPRSVAINTEMGVVVQGPGLAGELAELIERDMQPANSWEVVLDDSGKLRWVSGDEVLTRQPARSWWQRVQDVFFMMFPKEL
ncbi:MAG TPA: phospholipase D family protein, partial [Steroidobacteraceae bacterium]|nr:phospholipase D family protein [Steroidobacteraceae bacterium]